ncbi:PTS system mannose/fructose/sorbose family transporter subunit IID [Halanaerobium salsuginis]|uniref:PTS system IID component, Man family (TC 4.A.6) n=1 Tax=Halanaerobium salsuginis TaxID=29563 RepID=A0A1I4J932_9FIRM|nr:PTS system mannose/fructose/sorbose family transporter subunit IID [Halanaerobium salsuginis]SFL63098.1 PTS system IID component, Man family (TC 4.A.6) [Halanaerobium salsuginis]
MDNEKKKLTRKDLFASWLRWFLFNLSSISYERLASYGFCHSMLPIIEKLYDKKEEQIAALKRHSVFYNTEPQLGSIVNGITAKLEEARANGEKVDEEMINGIKVGLMGPLAGIGDSLIPGMLVPILLSIGMGLASGGSLLGPLFYIIAFNLIVISGSYYLYMKGYELGEESLELLMGEKAQKIKEAFAMLGAVVMGGVAANYVSLSTPLTYQSGEVNIVLQNMLDNIFPELLPLILVFVTWYLMSKKRISSIKIMLFMLVLAAAGVFLGIF